MITGGKMGGEPFKNSVGLQDAVNIDELFQQILTADAIGDTLMRDAGAVRLNQHVADCRDHHLAQPVRCAPDDLDVITLLGQQILRFGDTVRHHVAQNPGPYRIKPATADTACQLLRQLFGDEIGFQRQENGALQQVLTVSARLVVGDALAQKRACGL
ncbi:hypothetical protein [Breoghania sp.]|uniref:hypothetical protein n=1 Tax=Breoghania sp. TaxID=2065378 RepID=UPI002625F093|nr:hypothetical protein [Breoghania sp.]MDJ0931848.1 hypothetical protein [Breoghania sp.]